MSRIVSKSTMILAISAAAQLAACSGGSKSSASGDAATAPAISVAFFPDQENFGVVRYTQSSTAHSITLQNLSKVSYFISSITLSDETDFKIESHSCPGSTAPLSPSQSCEVEIIFKPSTSGDRSANLVATYGTAIGDKSLTTRSEQVGVGGSSLLFPGIDTISAVGGTSMTLNWTHVVNAKKYIVYDLSGIAAKEIARVDAPTKTYKVSGLTLNTKYTWRVRLVDSYGFEDNNERNKSETTKNSPQPTVTLVSPLGGALAGGSTVAVSGTDFQSGLSIKIGSVACAASTFNSPTSATCITAASAAGSYDVTVTNPDGQQGSFSSYTYQAAPAITSVSPGYGTWQGGTTITLSGTGFLTGPSVSVGGITCGSVNVLSSTSLTCVTGALGSASGGLVSSVTVTNSDGQIGTLASAYIYQFANSSLIAGNQYPFGCQGGAASNARFRTIRGLYYDGTDLLMVGYDSYAIWKASPTTGVVTRFSGKPCISGAADGPDVDATLSNPFSVVKVGADYYFTHYALHTIRKIDGATGAVTTIAGLSGTAGSTNATGTAARFNNPRGITTDGTYLYVADMTNHQIRKVDPATGAVTLLAGSTSGIVDATGAAAKFSNPRDLVYYSGSLYVADFSNNRIRQVVIATGAVTTFSGSGTAGHIDGAAAGARFNQPTGVTTDGTNLYVAERIQVIRRVSLADGSVSVLAGLYNSSGIVDNSVATSARFVTPEAIGTDGTYVYVADASETVRRINISSGEVSTFLGTYQTNYYGTFADGAAATFVNPTGVAINGDTAYVADYSNHRIRQVDLLTGVTSTLSGSGGAGGLDGMGAAATHNGPRDIVFCGGMLYVADYGGQLIRSVDPGSGTVTTIAGTYGTAGSTDGTGAAARFSNPNGLAIDSACTNLYVADLSNHRIRQVVVATGSVATVVGSGVNSSVDGVGVAATVASPAKLAIIGTDMYLTSNGDHKIRRISLSNFTVASLNGGTAGYLNASDISSARFYGPRGLTTDGTLLYVVEYYNHAVRLYDPATGTVTTVTANQSPGNISNTSLNPYGEVFGALDTTAQLGFPYAAAFSPTHGMILGSTYGIVRLK